MSAKHVYLHLFHGRDTKEEDMDDWGYSGPTIGPLQYVHTTYGATVKFRSPDDVLLGRYDDVIVFLEDGLFPWEGKFYGDWTVTGDPNPYA